MPSFPYDLLWSSQWENIPKLKNTRFHYTDRISLNSFLCWEQSASNVGFCENRELGKNWGEIWRRDWSRKQPLSPSEPEEVDRKAQWRSVSSFMHAILTDLTQGPMKCCRTLSFIFFPVFPFHSPSSLSLLLPILKYYGKQVWVLSYPNDSPSHEGNLRPWKPRLQRLCWPQSHAAAEGSLWCLALVVNLIEIRSI